MPSPNPLRRLIIRCAAVLGLAVVSMAPVQALAACGVTTPTTAIGAYGAPVVKAGGVPNSAAAGGFTCTSASILTLLTGNYLKATVTSVGGFKMTSGTTSDTVDFTLSAAADGTSPITAGVTRTFISGTSINLLTANATGATIYIKPSSAALVTPATYTATLSVTWDWYFCSGLGLFDACIGTKDTDTRVTTVKMTLVVPKPVITSMASLTTSDPMSGTNNPKAIPGAKKRITATVSNPNAYALDSNALTLVLPTPGGLAIALDGDGTSGTFAQIIQGGTPSALTLSYVGPGDSGDNVDFSSNGGSSWGYAPTAGNLASQQAVTHVRLRPQGAMAASSSAEFRLSYQQF